VAEIAPCVKAGTTNSCRAGAGRGLDRIIETYARSGDGILWTMEVTGGNGAVLPAAVT
jgi:hypothetical protein